MALYFLSLSSLEIDEFDGDCKDGEEEEDEGKEHGSRSSDHTGAISKAYFQVLFHGPLETLSHNDGVYVPKLRRYNSPQSPCNRADVVEPNPPSWEALVSNNRTEQRRPQKSNEPFNLKLLPIKTLTGFGTRKPERRFHKE